MPCFTAPINENGLPLLCAWVTNAVHNDGMKAEDIAQISDKTVEELGLRSCNALLDTGANVSCITERLAGVMELTIQGKDGFSSVSESTNANLYRVNIHIPFGGELKEQGGRIKGKVALSHWSDAKVMGIPGIDESFDIILGMDFISQGALHVSANHFTFCI